LLHAGENLETDAPSPAQTSATAGAGAPYFMCSPLGNSAGPAADPADAGTSGSRGENLGMEEPPHSDPSG
jgi:hypothetical protein